MKSLSGLIIALFLLLQAAAQPEWKLGIQTWTFHKFPLLEAVQKSRELGISYLEAYPGQRVGEGYNGSFSYNLSAEERRRLKEYFRQQGIQILAWGVVDKDYYRSRDNIENFFAFCRDMGIPFMTAEPEWEDLDEFERLAEKYNVKVGIHCHPRPGSHYWDPDSILLAMSGRKHIGAWPDVAHWARSGVNPVAGLKKLEGKLWGLHFKDVKEFGNSRAEDALFGEGAANLAAVLRELCRQKFRGMLSLEYEANPDSNMGDMRRNLEYYAREIKKLYD